MNSFQAYHHQDNQYNINKITTPCVCFELCLALRFLPFFAFFINLLLVKAGVGFAALLIDPFLCGTEFFLYFIIPLLLVFIKCGGLPCDLIITLKKPTTLFDNDQQICGLFFVFVLSFS